MNVRLILGGPGSGKTHTLLETMEDEMRAGVDPQAIAFVSFTRRAVNEARTRAMKKFGLKERSLPFFRTLHSLCYRQLGIRPSMVLGVPDLRKIGEFLGIPITGKWESEGEMTSIGDRMLFLDNLARSTARPLEDVWASSTGEDLSWYRLLQFSETLRRYKERKGVLDFADMLTRFGDEGGFVGVRVAIIDEAQDLTPAQWRVVDVAFSECERMHLAGDDDQAIYSWSGADVDRFLSIGADETTVISQSRRIPRAVFRVAESITKGITRRYAKKWGPRDANGSARRCASLSDVDLTTGSWFLLARNRCFLPAFEDECIRQGVTYTTRTGSSIDANDVRAIKLYEAARKGKRMMGREAALVCERLGVRVPIVEGQTFGVDDLVSSSPPSIWHDAFRGLPPSRIAYYLTILRRGGRVVGAPPSVHVDTIHGVKGGEADHVLLMVDETTRTEAGAWKRPDDEARVFYVGATRARESLTVLHPQTGTHWPFPL